VFRVRGRAQCQVLFLRRIDKNKTYQMCNESPGALQRIAGTQPERFVIRAYEKYNIILVQ